MNAKRILCASLVLFALLALTAPAWAGGWAVVTLDTLPTQVVAGQPFSIGFIVRQHGQRPMEGLAPTIILYSPDTGKTTTVTAKAEGAIGHYTAEVTFPSAGTWDWSIDAFGFAPQPMPRLTVLGAAPAVSLGTRASLSLPTLIGFIALIAAGGALVLLIRTRAAWAAALTLVAALVCVVSFTVTAKNATARTGGDGSPPALGPGASEADLGQALFLAKGCVVCHSHEAVLDARKDFADFNVGPNLSKVSRTPDYVRVWLKDPSLLKSGTEMPNLGLSSDEIEALIAFLKPGASQ